MVFEVLAAAPLLPVLTFDDVDDAVEVCEALRQGGIRVVEITLRTPAGAASIERVSQETDLLVGAGTVLTAHDARRVVGLGARFAVSPGYDPEVVGAVRDAGAVALPGVATATEVQRALRDGVEHVKVFPAASLGGPEYLRQLHAPFSGLGMLPSGGITPGTVSEYLSVPGVFAVAGGWFVSRKSPRDLEAIRVAAGSAIAAAVRKGLV